MTSSNPKMHGNPTKMAEILHFSFMDSIKTSNPSVKKPYMDGIWVGNSSNGYIQYPLLGYWVNLMTIIWGFPKNGGFPQQTHGVFLLKMISTWGVLFGGRNPPFKETPICKQRELIDQHRTSLFLTTEIVVVNPGGDSTWQNLHTWQFCEWTCPVWDGDSMLSDLLERFISWPPTMRQQGHFESPGSQSHVCSRKPRCFDCANCSVARGDQGEHPNKRCFVFFVPIENAALPIIFAEAILKESMGGAGIFTYMNGWFLW